MKKAILFATFCLITGLLCGANLRQDLSGHEDLSVGDRFYFNIRADVDLQSVALPDTITNFHVMKVVRKSAKKEASWLQLTLVPLLPGSHSFPALRVELAKPDGEEYYTERFRVNIIPVRAATDSLLVDIKPVERYPFQFPVWVYLMLLALMVLLAFLYVLLQRKPKTPITKTVHEPPTTKEIPLPEWKKSLDELHQLQERGLILQGLYIAHHYELSQILRRFLETKYHFAACEMTTSEIVRAVDLIRIEQSKEALSFLKYCDKVKFARYIPDWEEIEKAEAWLEGWLLAFEVVNAQIALAQQGGSNA